MKLQLKSERNSMIRTLALDVAATLVRYSRRSRKGLKQKILMTTSTTGPQTPRKLSPSPTIDVEEVRILSRQEVENFIRARVMAQ